VHPELLDTYIDGTFAQRWVLKPTRAHREDRLRPEEAATLAFFKHRGRKAKAA